MEEEYVWLSNLNLRNDVKCFLIKRCGGLDKFYKAGRNFLKDLKLNDNLISMILDKDLKIKSKYDLDFINKNDINILWIGDKNYPKSLKLIPDSPIVLFVKGNLEVLDNDAVGIVGARYARKEILDLTSKISHRLANDDINVVSGLSRGIEKYAHLGALKSKYGAKTIAVLGSGIDVIYPYENKKVYEEILTSGGAIISEYPIGTKPNGENFPKRNRIISGLSKLIIIMQTAIRGGCYTIVDSALDQGKDIYVYKDKYINEKYFNGNKALIEDGAKILDFS